MTLSDLPPPRLHRYEIKFPETIVLNAPRSSVLSDQETISQNSLVVRPSPGTVHLTGSIVDTTRMGSPAPLPIREAELVAGSALTERTLRTIERANTSDFVVKVRNLPIAPHTLLWPSLTFAHLRLDRPGAGGRASHAPHRAAQ